MASSVTSSCRSQKGFSRVYDQLNLARTIPEMKIWKQKEVTSLHLKRKTVIEGSKNKLPLTPKKDFEGRAIPMYSENFESSNSNDTTNTPRTDTNLLGKEDANENNVVKPKLRSSWYLNKTTSVILLLQAFYVIVFTAMAKYPPEADIRDVKNSMTVLNGGFAHSNLGTSSAELGSVTILLWVILFTSVNTIEGHLKVCFGELLLLFCLSFQWSILCLGLIESTQKGKITMNIERIIGAEFTCLSVLISSCLMLKGASILHLIVMQFFHVPLQLLVSHLLMNILQVNDCGKVLASHTFGSFFGFVAASVLSKKCPSLEFKKPTYCSDFLLSSGTVVLLIYWPSIAYVNSSTDGRLRVVLNTVLGMMASLPISWPLASIFSSSRKVSMITIQNGLFHAGVAISAVSPLTLDIYGAIIIGTLVTTICIALESVIKTKLPNALHRRLPFHIAIRHGISGVLGGVLSSIVALTASSEIQIDEYSVYELYPARAPVRKSAELGEVQLYLPYIRAGEGRSAVEQAGYQLLGLIVVIAVASMGGILLGFLLQLKIFHTSDKLMEEELPNSSESLAEIRGQYSPTSIAYSSSMQAENENQCV